MTAPIFGDPFDPNPGHWDDLDDTSLVPTGKTARELDRAYIDPAAQVSLGTRASTEKNRNQVAQFTCDACRGSGRFVRGFNNPRDYGPCNKCKGTGKLKTDPETRARRKEARRVAQVKQTEVWITQHQPEVAWMREHQDKFNFARSMLEAVHKYHGLTDGQLAAVRKCMAKDEERGQARVAAQANAPTVDGTGLNKMLAAFAHAKLSRLKYPKLTVGLLSFQPPGPTSSYKDGLFVKYEGSYVGRISGDGKWLPAPSRSTPGIDALVLTTCRDPLAAAVMHGKQTGCCSCCGRELENPESVALGIGPVCRAKWGL